MFRKLQSEQSKAIELVNSTKSAEESLEISQRLAKQNGKLKEERDCLEKRYITVNGEDCFFLTILFYKEKGF